MDAMYVMSSVTIILTFLAIAVAVLWIFLPFAVFGMKDLARSIIADQKRTNHLLSQLAAQNKVEQETEVKRVS